VEGARTLSAGRETTTQALEIDGRGALAPKIEIFYMRFQSQKSPNSFPVFQLRGPISAVRSAGERRIASAASQ
jgi:hypothetical protein